MKLRIVLLLFPMLYGCSSRPGEHAIREAEAVMNVRPDSALTILNAIPEEALNDESILYPVITLKAQANSKLGNDSIDARLLDKASRYFLRTGQKRYRLLAEYYAGMALEDSDDIEAINHFLNAEDLAKETRDSFFISGVYGHIAYIYNRNKSYKVELEYARKALLYHSPGKKDIFYFSDLDYLSGALINNKEYDEAIDNCRKLISEATAAGDERYSGLGYCSLGYAYMGKNDYGNAVDAFENMLSRNTDDLDPNDCRYIGLAYYMKGDYPKARHYFNMIDSVGEEGYLRYMPYQLDEKEGRLQDAIRKLKDELKYTNDVYGRSMNQVVTLSIIKRRENEKALAEMEAEMQKRMRIWISILASGGLGCGIFCFIRYRNRRRIREEELSEYARSLVRDVEAGEERYGNLYKAAIEVLRGSMDNVNEISQLMVETTDKRRLNRRLAEIAQNQIDCLRNDPEKIDCLKKSVNSLTDNIVDDFIRDYPDLSEKDRLLFLYTALGLSSALICFLLDTNHTSYYTRKSRLKTRVSTSSAARKREYLYLLR